jgi:hypothetical protein
VRAGGGIEGVVEGGECSVIRDAEPRQVNGAACGALTHWGPLGGRERRGGGCPWGCLTKASKF